MSLWDCQPAYAWRVLGYDGRATSLVLVLGHGSEARIVAAIRRSVEEHGLQLEPLLLDELEQAAA